MHHQQCQTNDGKIELCMYKMYNVNILRIAPIHSGDMEYMARNAILTESALRATTTMTTTTTMTHRETQQQQRVLKLGPLVYTHTLYVRVHRCRRRLGVVFLSFLSIYLSVCVFLGLGSIHNAHFQCVSCRIMYCVCFIFHCMAKW